MKTIPVLTSLFLLIASTNLPAAEPVRHVTVDGKGSVSAVPDMAAVSMSVEDRNLDIDAAKRRVNDVSADFLDLCRKLGIDESRVRSTGLSVYPERCASSPSSSTCQSNSDCCSGKCRRHGRFAKTCK